MKRILLSIVFLLMLCAPAWATDVTLSSFQPQFAWRYTGTVTLRVYVTQGFLDSTGVWVAASPVGGANFYKSITCTLNGTTLTVPSFTLPSNIDGRPNTSRYIFIFYSGATKRDTLLSGVNAGNIVWPTAYGATMTIAQLVTWNTTAPAPPRPGFPDTVQVQTLINQVLPVADASDVFKGKAKLSVAPASSVNPIAVGDNDPRINSPLGVLNVKDPAYGAVGDGVADDAPAIQAAINSIAGNKVIFFPPGTYKLSSNVGVYGRSNVELRGAGIGKTIIDGTVMTDAARQANGGWVGVGGTVSFRSASNVTTDSNNSIRDLTITGTTTMGTCTFGGLTCNRSMIITRNDNFTIERVEFNGSTGETVMVLGAYKNMRVLNSNFKNVLSANATGCFDTNTYDGDGTLIDGCSFEDVNFAIAVLGDNIRVVNNSFKRIAYKGIGLGESNYDATHSISSAVVANNVFTQLGYGSTASGAYGVDVITRNFLYADNTQDFGVLIANNVFVNSVAGNNVTCIRVLGTASVQGNYASGIDSGTGLGTFLSYYPGEDQPNHLYISHNIVQKTQAAINYKYGIAIAGTANTYVYLSGNNISATILGIYNTTPVPPLVAVDPYVSFNGDVFNGPVVLNVAGQGPTMNNAGELDNTPLYGDTIGGVRTTSSVSLTYLAELADSATPSVKGRAFVSANFAVPTTITNLTNGVLGQLLTILCGDANMTINNGGHFALTGTFTSANRKSITLLEQEGIWVEISRSAP